MIIFKTVRWKNFLSTGNVFSEIQLDTSPATLIVGANGAGNPHSWMPCAMRYSTNLFVKYPKTIG